MFHVKRKLQKDKFLIKIKDFIVSNEFFELYTDSETGITWTEVKANHNHLSYYQSENYIPHSDKKGLLGFLYSFSQRLMFVYKRILLMKQLKESRSFLDYGAGDEKFAKYLEKKGKKRITLLKGLTFTTATINTNFVFGLINDLKAIRNFSFTFHTQAGGITVQIPLISPIVFLIHNRQVCFSINFPINWARGETKRSKDNTNY